MKKILIVALVLIASQVKSQVILQNVVSEFQGKIRICADTTDHKDYSCQISEVIDSVDVCPEYTEFVAMCASLSGKTVTSFVLQNTIKQTFDATVTPRVFVMHNDEQYELVYNSLIPGNKIKFDAFIYKIKSLIN